MMSISGFVFIAFAAFSCCTWNPAQAWTNNNPSVSYRSGSHLFQSPAPKHDVRGGKNSKEELTLDQKERVNAFVEHQQNVPTIGFAADVRSLVQYNHGFAVMSTNSKLNSGFPGGSVVGFSVDDDGRPVFVFSGMSSHTMDILKDPRCSLTIADKNFKGAADGRVNLMGTCNRVKDDDEINMVKEIYLQKHPGAFWVNFGDFFFYRMEIEAIRFVGGFARAGSVTPKDYKNAAPDPIMVFGQAIASHMNDDHSSSTIAMVNHYIPSLDGDDYVKEAIINRVDSLGMDIKITRDPDNTDRLPGQPQQFKVRLPFPKSISERAGVKSAIVEMTQASAAKSSQKEVEKTTKEAQ